MKNNKIFNDVLNECIERVLKGVSIEACLKSFPEYAAELEPLLRTAVDTHKAAGIKPRPEFRQRAGYEFQTAIRDMKPNRSGFLRWHLGWVTAVSVVIVILLAGSSTIAASANSLPDGSLYGVKLFTEEMRLVLTTSPTGKAELHTEYADKRVDEIIKMADKGNVQQVVKTTERMNDNLASVARLIQPDTDTGASEEIAPQPLMNTPADMKSTNVTVASMPAPVTGVIGPAATRVPAPVTAPAPALTLKPTPTATPNTAAKAPSATVKTPSTAAKAPSSFFKVTPAPVARSVTANVTKQAVTEKVNLKTTVSRQAEKNDQALQEALKKAPDSVKPALEKAIKDAQKGYEEALKDKEFQRK